jgi:hypothetical protein
MAMKAIFRNFIQLLTFCQIGKSAEDNFLYFTNWIVTSFCNPRADNIDVKIMDVKRP